MRMKKSRGIKEARPKPKSGYGQKPDTGQASNTAHIIASSGDDRYFVWNPVTDEVLLKDVTTLRGVKEFCLKRNLPFNIVGRRTRGQLQQLRAQKAQRPQIRYRIFSYHDGYRVCDMWEGKVIQQEPLTLDQAEQFCRDSGAPFDIAAPAGKTFGESGNAPKRPSKLPRITPFALAHVASQLALFHRDQSPHCYLPEASELLLDAAAYLEGLQKEQTIITFNQVLGKEPMPPGLEWSGKTPLTGITTRDGLLKAIRREFDLVDAEGIIAVGCMTRVDFEFLRSRLTERRSRNARDSRRAKKAHPPKKK